MKKIAALLLASVLFGCAAPRVVKVPDPVIVEKVVTKDVVVSDPKDQDEISRLRARVADLERFDARVVCGDYCAHRGKPAKRLPPCR